MIENVECWNPARIISNYVESRGNIAVLPSPLEALAYIARLSRDVKGNEELARLAEETRSTLEKLEDEVVDPSRFEELAERLKEIVDVAEKSLNAPLTRVFYRAS